MRHILKGLVPFIIVLFASILAGCPQEMSTPDPVAQPPVSEQVVANAAEQPFTHPNVDLAASKAELAVFENEIQKAIKARDFDGLDKMAAKFRDGKERFIGGGWKIHSFYKSVPQPSGKATEIKWNAHLAFLQAWKKASPQSVTAQCALAAAYIYFGWFARGEGYAPRCPNRRRSCFTDGWIWQQRRHGA